jgi:GT2 family glycosyltransferase
VPDSSPGILVVLPTLGDRLDFLEKTLDSVAVQRDQVELTLVVVSPPGAERARDLASRYDAVLVDDPKEGISAAINRGLGARDGQTYYAWVGDDDIFRPDGLAHLQRMLDADADAVVAYGACDYIDPEGRTLWVSQAGPLALRLLAWGPNLIPNPAALIRLDALEAIGGFDERLRYAMDLEAFLSLRRHGRFLSTRTPVAAFRWHPDSLTVANRRASTREAEAIKRRHLPSALRPLAPVWELPIRLASEYAAGRLTARARRAEPAAHA